MDDEFTDVPLSFSVDVEMFLFVSELSVFLYLRNFTPLLYFSLSLLFSLSFEFMAFPKLLLSSSKVVVLDNIAAEEDTKSRKQITINLYKYTEIYYKYNIIEFILICL